MNYDIEAFNVTRDAKYYAQHTHDDMASCRYLFDDIPFDPSLWFKIAEFPSGHFTLEFWRNIGDPVTTYMHLVHLERTLLNL